MSAISDFTNPFFKENPVLTLLLGLCPALAVSNQAINGLGMGLATTFVLIGSNVVVSSLKKYIPDKIRIPSYIIIIASFVTLVKILMKAYMYDLSLALGIFIPLIVVNCMILGRAEMFASKNSVGRSFIDALGMGISFTITLTILSILREIPGSGEITFKLNYGEEVLGAVYNLKPYFTMIGLEIDGKASTILVFIMPAGGFIVLGLFLALFNRLTSGESKGGHC
jgi:electron transport complex protein RnfE